jgi:hypothetical protein
MHGHPLPYRRLRLDGPIQELHQAVDRLRSDTVPALLDHQPPTSPFLPRRRRHDPGDGQAALVEEASCTSTCT